MAAPHLEFLLPIPTDVKWVAQDNNGKWWGYTAEPHRNDTGWYENEVGRYIYLGTADHGNWQYSVQAVNQP